MSKKKRLERSIHVYVESMNIYLHPCYVYPFLLISLLYSVHSIKRHSCPCDVYVFSLMSMLHTSYLRLIHHSYTSVTDMVNLGDKFILPYRHGEKLGDISRKVWTFHRPNGHFMGGNWEGVMWLSLYAPYVRNLTATTILAWLKKPTSSQWKYED